MAVALCLSSEADVLFLRRGAEREPSSVLFCFSGDLWIIIASRPQRLKSWLFLPLKFGFLLVKVSRGAGSCDFST